MERPEIVTGTESTDRLIWKLGADLTPVRRLSTPLARVLAWLAIIAAIAVVLATLSDLGSVGRRLSASTDMWLSAIGSVATAVLAAVAAFELSLPDRKPIWALLPLPAAFLWIAASGIGCLRSWFVADASSASLAGTERCLIFILGFSIPLSAVLMVLLRRGYSLHPNLTSIVGGLACATAAATLLNFFHPYDATATDLSVHAFAVAFVVLANRIIGGHALADKNLLVTV
jgi:hypothetical protein